MDRPKPVKEQKQRENVKPKVVFSLDTPMPLVEWPVVRSNDQNTIMELLCSLLEPIGQHRTLLDHPPKSERSKKRKRSADPPPSLLPPPPPPPELVSFLTVGLNSTTAHLEELAAKSAPPSLPAASRASPVARPPLRAVFVCRADSQPSQLHSHIPVLCGLASMENPVRLVQLPKGANARLAASLAIARVGFLGVMEGAPGSSPLVAFLDRVVSAVKIPWLAHDFDYRQSRIKAMNTTTLIGRGKKKKERKRDKKPGAS